MLVNGELLVLTWHQEHGSAKPGLGVTFLLRELNRQARSTGGAAELDMIGLTGNFSTWLHVPCDDMFLSCWIGSWCACFLKHGSKVLAHARFGVCLKQQIAIATDAIPVSFCVAHKGRLYCCNEAPCPSFQLVQDH
jgi:hypothetical protein